MLFRKTVYDDLPKIQRVFRSAVLAVDQGYYTKQELDDWASCGGDTEKWRKKIEDELFFVAQNKEDQIVGFVSITKEGYLDLLYVDGSIQRQGIGAMLLGMMESQAKTFGCQCVTSEVSRIALPLFLKHGYRVEKEQKRLAHTLELTNFLVYKDI